MHTQIRVLHSINHINETTNPYVTQLFESLSNQVDNLIFSWAKAFFGNYQIFHAQWPEFLVRDKNTFKQVLKRVFFFIFLFTLRLKKIPVVQTLHNIEPHETSSRIEKHLLSLLDQQTAHWIRLNKFTPSRAPSTTTILHGHYKKAYKFDESVQPTSGRILFFGLIREYKGIESLIKAYSALNPNKYSLHIVGRPVSDQAREMILNAKKNNPNIYIKLGHLSTSELAMEILNSELVVLPYKKMHNSGAALLALSLARPVLVPDNEINAALENEVGGEWVIRFSSELSSNSLVESCNTFMKQSQKPNLDQRNWPIIANQHESLYRSLTPTERD